MFMKNFKTINALFALMAMVGVLSLSGCNDNKAYIERVEQQVCDLEERVAVLETFKTWAETLDGGFQDQIDELRASLEEARRLIDGSGDNAELAARLDKLIAGSTLTIAQIQSRLESHDKSIKELYELLGAIEGGGDISALLERIAALEQADKEILKKIENLSFGPDGPTLAELTALIEEMVDEALANLVQSIVWAPQTSGQANSRSVAMEYYVNETSEVVKATATVHFLVAPAALASTVAEVGVEGVLNTLTRTVSADVIPATVLSTAATGEIVVEFDMTTAVTANPDSGLQVALKVFAKEITSEMVTLTSDDTPTTMLTEVELTDWTNGGRAVDTTEGFGTTSPPTPFADIPADGFLGFPDGGNLPLDLVTADTDYALLENPELAYTEAALYSYDTTAGAWVAVEGTEVEIDTNNELVMPAGLEEGVNYRIVVSFEVTASNLLNPYQAQFAVELPFVKYVDTIAIALEGGAEIPAEGLALSTADTDGVQLAALLTPDDATNKNVEWTVAPEGVVTVENGLVKVVGKGPAVITVTALGSEPGADPVTASVAVNVTAYVSDIAIAEGSAPTEAVTAVTIDGLGQTATLVPIFSTGIDDVEPDDITVTWSAADDNTVIEIVDGLVTAIAVGSTTVTVTSGFTEDGLPVVSDPITVNVVSPVTKVTIIPGALILPVVADDTQLAVELSPAGAYDSEIVSWTSDDPAVVTVSSTGLVSVVGVGTATITAESANGVKGTCTVEVTNDLTGVEIGEDDLAGILDEFVLKSADDVAGIDPNNVAQLWNMPKGTASGNSLYNVGEASPFPVDGVLLLEDQLELALGGAADLNVAYEIVGQARWQQTTNNNNWFLSSSTSAEATLDAGPPATIVTNGTTVSGNGHNIYGDRLVIKVTVTVDPADSSGLTLDPDPLVTYICVTLP
jgi:uncharacterized protein YjdB